MINFLEGITILVGIIMTSTVSELLISPKLSHVRNSSKKHHSKH